MYKSTNYLISCKVRFYQGYQLFCNRVYFPPSPVSTHQAELYVDCYLLSLSTTMLHTACRSVESRWEGESNPPTPPDFG